MAPSGATTILHINLASGSVNANGNGTTKSGGTTGGGGARASTSTRSPFPILNLVVEFFRELQRNYQGVRIEKLTNLQDFQCKPHESL